MSADVNKVHLDTNLCVCDALRGWISGVFSGGVCSLSTEAAGNEAEV